MADVRVSLEQDVGGRDLSPSQRERYLDAEITEYQKPEIIRQAIKLVKSAAAETAAKRTRATSEIKSPSKIK